MKKAIEFYSTPEGEIMVKAEGEPVRILTETGEENRQFITEFISYISTFYTEAWNALSEFYSKKEPNRLNYEYWIVSRFIRCNFGEYDNNAPDIDNFGHFNFEEVKCPIRNECKLCGVCCKPKFNSSLTFRETNILRMFVDHYKADEIAERLFISPNTVKNHLRNIHIKTKTHTLAELVEYWHKNNLK